MSALETSFPVPARVLCSDCERDDTDADAPPDGHIYIQDEKKCQQLDMNIEQYLGYFVKSINSLCLASSRRSRTVNTLKLSLTTLFYLQGGQLEGQALRFALQRPLLLHLK